MILPHILTFFIFALLTLPGSRAVADQSVEVATRLAFGEPGCVGVSREGDHALIIVDGSPGMPAKRRSALWVGLGESKITKRFELHPGPFIETASGGVPVTGQLTSCSGGQARAGVVALVVPGGIATVRVAHGSLQVVFGERTIVVEPGLSRRGQRLRGAYASPTTGNVFVLAEGRGQLEAYGVSARELGIAMQCTPLSTSAPVPSVVPWSPSELWPGCRGFTPNGRSMAMWMFDRERGFDRPLWVGPGGDPGVDVDCDIPQKCPVDRWQEIVAIAQNALRGCSRRDITFDGLFGEIAIRGNAIWLGLQRDAQPIRWRWLMRLAAGEFVRSTHQLDSDNVLFVALGGTRDDDDRVEWFDTATLGFCPRH